MDYIYLYIDKTGYKACSSVIGNKIRLTQLKYYKLIDSSKLNSYNKFNLSVNRIAFRRIYLIHMITVFYILLPGKNLSLISAVLRLLIIYLFIKMNPITCILNLFITVS